MNDKIRYIEYDEALDIYHKTIKASDGGFEGIRDEGGLHSALEFIKNNDYYPTFDEKLTHLVYQISAGHLANDGCKRFAITLGAYFLHKNEYYWQACIFMRQLESIVYHVAAGNISKDILQRVITCFMKNQDYDEELKIEIFNAIEIHT